MASIGGFFKAIGRALKKVFISSGFAAAAQDELKSEAGQLALAVVKDLATTGLSTAEKREKAVKQIRDEAEARGLELKESLTRLLVELAVQEIKGAFGA